MSDGLTKRIEGKHNFTKGGKIVLARNANISMQRAFAHMHEDHNDEGFAQVGPREVKLIMDKIDPLVIDDKNLNVSESNINHS